jgi:hypothetical protein
MPRAGALSSLPLGLEGPNLYPRFAEMGGSTGASLGPVAANTSVLGELQAVESEVPVLRWPLQVVSYSEVMGVPGSRATILQCMLGGGSVMGQCQSQGNPSWPVAQWTAGRIQAGVDPGG